MKWYWSGLITLGIITVCKLIWPSITEGESLIIIMLVHWKLIDCKEKR